MRQAVVYNEREMILPPGQNPRCAKCEHGATWVVDLGSRRVIRRMRYGSCRRRWTPIRGRDSSSR